ncbi:hypothetical protein AB0M41_45565 [Streptomyces sp. NPDC051896]|uniref:hypothetical protein n=1 Tax=Streptomyces sp. NPDC051896 TaxID=3155416 RepID=UPI0034458063
MPSCSVTRPQPRPQQAKPVVGRGWGFCHRCARLVALLLFVVGPALIGLGYASTVARNSLSLVGMATAAVGVLIGFLRAVAL